MPNSIRPLQPEDRSNWERLYRAYAAFYGMPMEQSTLDTVWEWINDADNSFYGFISKDEQGNAIGMMHCRAMPSPLRGAMIGFLDDLFVDPSHRGSGIVQQMYKTLATFGKQQGWPFFRWITAENNYRGRGSYDKIADKTQWVTYQMPTDSEPDVGS